MGLGVGPAFSTQSLHPSLKATGCLEYPKGKEKNEGVRLFCKGVWHYQVDLVAQWYPFPFFGFKVPS